MEVNINTGSEFKRQFKRLMKKYHSLLHDFDVWKQELKNNPLAEDDLGAGVRKIRMAINSKGKGKSGGARILTLNILLDAETMDITLLTIQDKGEISNLEDVPNAENLAAMKEAESGHDAGVVRVDSLESFLASMEEQSL